MEKITGNNRRLIENCITFARKFLVLPEQIELFFEDCPSDRFPKANNAAELLKVKEIDCFLISSGS